MGDVIAQQAVERRGLRRQEWSRSAKMSLIGFTFTVSYDVAFPLPSWVGWGLHHCSLVGAPLSFQGPVLRGWFALLDRTFGPSMTASVVVKKLLMDQVWRV